MAGLLLQATDSALARSKQLASSAHLLLHTTARVGSKCARTPASLLKATTRLRLTYLLLLELLPLPAQLVARAQVGPHLQPRLQTLLAIDVVDLPAIRITEDLYQATAASPCL